MRIRITFSKQGALKYTGHLDLHRLWERAARRADLPLAYSKGFHPQPKLCLAAALPLGFSSRAELIDLRLNQDVPLDEVTLRLSDTLPAGIQVLKVESVDESAPALQAQVRSAIYEVQLLATIDVSELRRRVEQSLNSHSLPRERRGKSYDLRPLIESLSVVTESGERPRLRMRLSAREGATGRPEEVLDVLDIASENAQVERTDLVFD